MNEEYCQITPSKETVIDLFNYYIEQNNMYLMTQEEHKRYIDKINKLQKQLQSIKFYIEQSDIKNMLWGKEILKIIGGNDEKNNRNNELYK